MRQTNDLRRATGGAGHRFAAVVAPPQPPRETIQVKAVRPDRDHLEIRFPRVAGYRVESLLGRGGMSVVYLAEHVRLGRKVALKVLATPIAHDQSYRERFVRESQRAADLDHPNVIPIYDAGEIEDGDAEGLLYIAMRYVAGSDLRALLKRDGQLSVGRTMFMLEQVAALRS